MGTRNGREAAPLVREYAEARGCSLRTAQRARVRDAPDWVKFVTGRALGGIVVPAEPVDPVEEMPLEESGTEPARASAAAPARELHVEIFAPGTELPGDPGSVERTRYLVEASEAAYFRALSLGRVDLITVTQRQWRENAELLRKIEASDPKTKAARGEYVARVEVEKALADIHLKIAQTFRLTVAYVMRNAAEYLEMNAIGQQQEARRLTDTTFRTMKAGKFAFAVDVEQVFWEEAAA